MSQQAPPPYPPQGQYPPQGYAPQQPPRRKSWPRRHKILTALLAIVALFVIIGIASAGGGGGNSGNSTGSTSTGTTSGGSGQQAAAPAAAGPHIGQSAADGKFRFVVTRVSHAASVGDTADGLGETAQGRFTELHVRVTNIGNESQSLDDSAQFVYDSRGRKFSADTAADLDANPGNGGGVFLNDINPGNSVTGVILFDLPRGDKAVKAELHDSVFSGGVTVALHH